MNTPTTPPPIKLTQWLDTMPMADDPADMLATSGLPIDVLRAMRRNIVRQKRADGLWKAAQRLAILWGL